MVVIQITIRKSPSTVPCVLYDVFLRRRLRLVIEFQPTSIDAMLPLTITAWRYSVHIFILTFGEVFVSIPTWFNYSWIFFIPIIHYVKADFCSLYKPLIIYIENIHVVTKVKSRHSKSKYIVQVHHIAYHVQMPFFCNVNLIVSCLQCGIDIRSMEFEIVFTCRHVKLAPFFILKQHIT